MASPEQGLLQLSRTVSGPRGIHTEADDGQRQ